MESDKKFVVINVLDKNYFDDAHITGSINIPYDQLAEKMHALDKNGFYVVYCAGYMCSASSNSAKLLQKAGFKHVFAYEGGIVEWYQKGYPVTGPAQLDYVRQSFMVPDHHENEIVTMTAEQLRDKMR